MSRDYEIDERSIEDAYNSGFDDGINEAFRRVDMWIDDTVLEEPEASIQEGMIIAADLIMNPREPELPAPIIPHREWSAKDLAVLRKAGHWPAISYSPAPNYGQSRGKSRSTEQ
jgi:hypothetical protein